jgi:hypothetical protein
MKRLAYLLSAIALCLSASAQKIDPPPTYSTIADMAQYAPPVLSGERYRMVYTLGSTHLGDGGGGGWLSTNNVTGVNGTTKVASKIVNGWSWYRVPTDGSLLADGSIPPSKIAGGVGSGTQTPWGQDIDAAGHNISNLGTVTARGTLNIFGAREYGEIPLTGTTPSLSFTSGPVYSETLSATDITIALTDGLGTAGLTNRPIEFRVTTDGTHLVNFPASVIARTWTNQPFAAGDYTFVFEIAGGKTNLWVSPAKVQTADIVDGAVTFPKLVNATATQRAIGRNTAGSGNWEEVTESQMLDWIASTRGSLLYRGASGWAVLAPGTIGQVLTSNGSGADPSYQPGGAGGGLGYVLTFTGGQFNPASSTTYYFGNQAGASPSTTQGREVIYVPKAGTIKVGDVMTYASTAGSGESWTFSVAVNNGTPTTIQALSSATNIRHWRNAALSIAVAAGDYVEILTTTPSFSVNPASMNWGANLYIE